MVKLYLVYKLSLYNSKYNTYYTHIQEKNRLNPLYSSALGDLSI